MATSPHALFVPYPAQGHVLPLLELAHRFADHGFAVTFVNTDHIHGHLVAASPELAEQDEVATPGRVRLISVPDGLPVEDARVDLGTLTSALQSTLPASVEGMIKKGQFCCMVVDYGMTWVLGIAKKAGMRTAALWPSCAAVMAQGWPCLSSSPTACSTRTRQEIQIVHNCRLADGQRDPPVGDLQMNLAPLCWNAVGTDEAQKHIFGCLKSILKVLGTADLLMSNTVKELEEGILSRYPTILPVGPLPTGLRQGKPLGNFWPEDASCMSWLDKQADRSVVYVAFGSIAVLDRKQFHELARGLELSGRPFLWVVRPGLADDLTFPDGFLETVAKRGKIVSWSPQHKVLAHPAISCFVSHCGWNSVMEGVRNGLPFLTWPYFADQFINESYVCDVWKTGLRLLKDDDSGLVTSSHIATQLEKLLNDAITTSRAFELQQVAFKSISKDGTSQQNLETLINTMRG
ncbi:hypothetical protein EJB05_22366, partial [Eragrostis curvula]